MKKSDFAGDGFFACFPIAGPGVWNVVQIDRVDRLESDPSGKLRMLISEIEA